LALALLAPVAGCATLPISGPVVSEPRRSQAADPEGAAINADPPPAGASPSLIIDGFLHAMATYQPGYPAARQYLTKAAKTSWEPASGALVYADGTAPKVTADRVTMEVPLVGSLGSDGAFVAPSDRVWTHDFGLVKEDGEWRISNPSPGLLISRYLFSSGFVRHDVFFLDSRGDEGGGGGGGGGGGWSQPATSQRPPDLPVDTSDLRAPADDDDIPF